MNNPLLAKLGAIAADNDRDIYAVGGYVRDLFLQRPSDDIDFVTVGSGIELAKIIKERLPHSSKLTVYANYGTAQIRCGNLELEFVGARRESYSRDSRNPIVEDGTLADDLARRDFTINAMAADLTPDNFGNLIDPYNGIDDLKARIIRTPLDPDITFSDDPLRMMRAIRFATQLDFRIFPETFEAIRRNRERITIITRERINTELSKIMRSPRPSIGWHLLDMAGLLEFVFPQLLPLKGVETVDGRGHKDNFSHTLKVLDNVAARSDNEWLRWGALLHDIGKPATKRFDPKHGWTFHNHNFIGKKMIPQIFRELKMPLNEKMKYVAKLVDLHMRPQSVADAGVTDSGVRRLITDAGDDLPDLMLLAESDITSRIPQKVKRQLHGFEMLRQRIESVRDADALRNWKNPVNGNEIMDYLGLTPSPETGREIQRLKDAVKDAILDGRIPCDHDAAWQFLLSLLPENP